MKTIAVSDEVWAELTRIKSESKFKNLNAVIADLLRVWKLSKQ